MKPELQGAAGNVKRKSNNKIIHKPAFEDPLWQLAIAGTMDY